MNRLKFILLALTFVITGCLNEDDPDTPEVFKKAQFTMAANAPQVPADGNTTSQITLTLSADSVVPIDGRAIFKASGGSFSNGKSSDTVALSGSTASAFLSNATAETVRVEASLGGTTESTGVTFTSVAQSAAFTLSATTDNVAADGASQAVVTLNYTDLSSDASASQVVTFSLNAGLFSNGQMSMDIPLNTTQMNALAFLSHNTAETVLLTAQLQGQTATQEVVFVNAEPEVILVNPGSATITNAVGQRVTLTAQLLRDKGTTTTGQMVVWSAMAGGGVTPGILVNQTRSGPNGMATVEYVMQDTTYTGSISFVAEFTKTDGNKISGSNTVFVQDSN